MHGSSIESVLRWIVLGSIFALPFIVFIVAQSLFFPFITGKNFAFRILVEIGAAAYLALALTNVSYRPKRSILLGAFALFVVVIAFADVFGVYPFKSFWSNFERMDGWVTLAHLFLYFVVASAMLNTEKLWRTFFQVELGVSALVALYALLQLFGVASLSTGFSSLSRLDATFGNPIYLAVYMLFNVGIASLLFARRRQESVRVRDLASWLYAALIVLDTFILLLTGTRGTMLGLLAGIVVGATLLVFSGDVSRRVSRIALSVLIAVIALCGVFFLVREQSWIARVPVLNRLATISVSDNTAKARFMNWGMAWEGVKERPLLGWGQENYAIVFDKYYDPGMYAAEQWFDRVHNIIFDWLVAAGFLGLLSYLSLFAAAFLAIFRRDTFDPLEKSILTGLFAAYFIHNLFVFDNIMSYVLFTTVLAYIATRAARGNTPLSLPQVSYKYLPVVAALALVLLWGMAWYVNARALSANRALLQALAPHQEGIAKNLDYFKQSIALRTLGTQEAREQLLQAAAQVVRAEGVPQEVKQDFFTTAVQEMSEQAASSPLDARFPLFLGVLLNGVGDVENAANVLVRALELSPTKQTILFELGANALARGKADEALAYFQKAYELEPNFSDARLYYAALAIRQKKESLANELLAPLLESGAAADARIAAAYVSIGRYDKVAYIWEKRIASTPNDLNAYFTLAAAYYGAGNTARAITVLQKAGTLSPEAKAQADALIAEIKSGTAKLSPN